VDPDLLKVDQFRESTVARESCPSDNEFGGTNNLVTLYVVKAFAIFFTVIVFRIIARMYYQNL